MVGIRQHEVACGALQTQTAERRGDLIAQHPPVLILRSHARMVDHYSAQRREPPPRDQTRLAQTGRLERLAPGCPAGSAAARKPILRRDKLSEKVARDSRAAVCLSSDGGKGGA